MFPARYDARRHDLWISAGVALALTLTAGDALAFSFNQSAGSGSSSAETLPSERLEAGRPVQGDLRAGARKRMSFKADAGDLVYGSLQGRPGTSLQATVVGPSGKPVRDLMGGYIAFVAPVGGHYEIQMSNSGTTDGGFSLNLDVARPIGTAAAAARSMESLRMQAIAAEAAKGEFDADAFWRQVSGEGTPLIEQAGNDFLVTFLWRGAPETRTVKVQWPFFHVAPLVELHPIANTDIWFRTFRFAPGTRFNYSMLPDPPLVEGPAMLQALSLIAVAQSDPLNKMSQVAVGGGNPGASFVELPPAIAKSEWTSARSDVSKGEISSFQFDSKILGNSRRISVYTPPGYRPDGGPYGLIMLFDGGGYQTLIPVPTILDNLISEKRIAPTVAVFIDNASIESRSGEMYPNQAFTDFVSLELLSLIRSKFSVTRKPEATVIGGFSLGGLAATHIAWRKPHLFGRVLSQSGAFWWSRQAIEAGRGEPILTEGPLLDPRVESFELVNLIAKSPKSPVRLYLEAGVYEGDLLTANRFMRDVLTAKNYELLYREFPGGHDGTYWRESFAEGLISLIGDCSQGPSRCAAGGDVSSPAPKIDPVAVPKGVKKSVRETSRRSLSEPANPAE